MFSFRCISGFRLTHTLRATGYSPALELGYYPVLELGYSPALVLVYKRYLEYSSALELNVRGNRRTGTTSNPRCGIKITRH